MSVLALGELRDGEVLDVSDELVTAACDAAAGQHDVHVALVGPDVERHRERANRVGVDVLHLLETEDGYNHDVYVRAIEKLESKIQPKVLVMPHSANGLDYAPAAASRLDIPLVTDVTNISAEDGVVVTRELYGSKLESTVSVEPDRAALTIRPGEWQPADASGDAEVRSEYVEFDSSKIKSSVVTYEFPSDGDVDITDADFVVAIGRGIEEEENLELIRELCDVTDATLVASRPVVDNGWVSKSRQVGQSGKVVSPDVYIAIGISGAVQHVAGMKDSEHIIAINTDPNAPIFEHADYGIEGDLFDIVPELIKQCQER